MRHRLYWLNGLRKEDEHPAYTPVGSMAAFILNYIFAYNCINFRNAQLESYVKKSSYNDIFTLSFVTKILFWQ